MNHEVLFMVNWLANTAKDMYRCPRIEVNIENERRYIQCQKTEVNIETKGNSTKVVFVVHKSHDMLNQGNNAARIAHPSPAP